MKIAILLYNPLLKQIKILTKDYLTNDLSIKFCIIWAIRINGFCNKDYSTGFTHVRDLEIHLTRLEFFNNIYYKQYLIPHLLKLSLLF